MGEKEERETGVFLPCCFPPTGQTLLQNPSNMLFFPCLFRPNSATSEGDTVFQNIVSTPATLASSGNLDVH